MLHVNCELPIEPHEHFTLWFTVTKLEPSYRTQLTGGWSRTPQRRSNAKPLFCLRGLHLHRRFAGDYVTRAQGCRGFMDFLRFIKGVSPKAYCKQYWSSYLQAVEALRCKPEGSGLDSRLGHWNFSWT